MSTATAPAPAEGLRRHGRAVRWTTTLALAVSVLIIFTGGVVRVTGSGLGCPTWPRCSEGSFVAAGASYGLHDAIEFGNRALTGVVVVAVAAVILACLLERPRSRVLLVSGIAQLLGVFVNAVVGGITVLTGLNPYVVGGHFLAAMLLLVSTTVSYDIAHRSAVPRPHAAPRRAARWLVVVTSVLVVLGVVTTGAGPHPGDSLEVHRIPLHWASVTTAHGLTAATAIALAAVVLVLARRHEDALLRRRAGLLLALLLAQGGIGLYQSLGGMPELAVALHLLGAALTWVGTIRVLLATRMPALGGPRRATGPLPV